MARRPIGKPIDESLPEHLRYLKDGHRKFVQAYARTGNGTQSAIAAGYSAHTASIQGSALCKREDVRRAIAIERIALSDTQWGDKEVLEVLRKEATATGEGTSAAARVAAARAYGEALGLFKRPDLDALASLQRIEIVLVLPDGSKLDVGGAALLKPAEKSAGGPEENVT
jgi:hypothetical protein